MNIVYETRRDAGLTQREMAEVCGVDVTTYSRMENGTFEASREVCEAISRRLKLKFDDVMKALDEERLDYFRREREALAKRRQFHER